jgi:PadR family transcriptional regulator, regulatory protein AphA
MAESSSIDFAVLGLLYDRPLHGYELYRQYAQGTGLSVIWKVKRSHFYAILGRMARSGLVDMEIREQENHPPRKVYRLTDEGGRVFRVWMTSPVMDSHSFRLDFPAKLLFSRRIDPEAARKLLSDQQALCGRWLSGREDALQKALARKDPDDFDALVFRFRVGQIRAMSEWLTECEKILIGTDFQVEERNIQNIV